MLTITVEYPDRRTNTHECLGVEHDPSGVLVRYEDGPPTHYKRESEPRGYRFYVMNRHGATIATYQL